MALFSLAGMYACKKDSFTASADAHLSFSADTLSFDTVFTATGSVTRSFKIINPNDQKLRLSSIQLAGGPTSPFKMNVNGKAGTTVQDHVIHANDSMYIFVQVLVDPDDRTQPFILEDSIEVQYNGNKRWIQLRAFGQNAIFLKNHQVQTDTVWNSLLPIVVSGSVRVDSGVSLRILEGTRVFLHATAPFIVDGSLEVNGNPNAPVIFSGDRTDPEYKDLPASWPGIYFTATSRNNVLRSTIIKNAYQGIIMEQMPDDGMPKLVLSRSVITNIYDAGILAVNASIKADNSLIANCGSNLVFMLGGDYTFTNCTIATYGSFYLDHKNPVVQLSDHFEQAGSLFTADLRALFINSIIWGDHGSVENEIWLSKKGVGAFEATFDHCIYKVKEPVAHATFQSSLLNSTPLFDSINVSRNIYDFRFRNHPESPAVKAGKPVPYRFDLDGHLRVNPPDIGCYER